MYHVEMAGRLTGQDSGLKKHTNALVYPKSGQGELAWVDAMQEYTFKAVVNSGALCQLGDIYLRNKAGWGGSTRPNTSDVSGDRALAATQLTKHNGCLRCG